MKEHQHRGLTSAQVEESRRLHGDNLITPRKGDSAWKLFAEKFRDPIIQVLLVAALAVAGDGFIDGEFLETIGIYLRHRFGHLCRLFLRIGRHAAVQAAQSGE